MFINKNDLYYGMVAFIYLMGFSDQVKGVKKMNEIDRLVQKIIKIRKEFDMEANVKKLIHEELIAFSDCLIISIAAKSDISNLEGTYDTWLSEILWFALSQYKCVMAGHFIRGGLSMGHWYHKDNVIVSPAQIESYEIEQEKACYPIIALSTELANYLTNPKEYTRWYNYNPTKNMLKKDSRRKLWFIDYLGCSLEELDWRADQKIIKKYKNSNVDDRGKVMTEGWKKNAKLALKKHKDEIIKAYKVVSLEKVRKKYRWLARYHNSVVKRYGNVFQNEIIVLPK